MAHATLKKSPTKISGPHISPIMNRIPKDKELYNTLPDIPQRPITAFSIAITRIIKKTIITANQWSTKNDFKISQNMRTTCLVSSLTVLRNILTMSFANSGPNSVDVEAII